MILLTKRDDSNPSGLYDLTDLISLLNKNNEELLGQIEELKLELDKTKKSIPKPVKINKTVILDKLTDKKVVKFKGVNISNVGNIEKDEDILNGTIYYNEKLNLLRLKATNGWKSLNFIK